MRVTQKSIAFFMILVGFNLAQAQTNYTGIGFPGTGAKYKVGNVEKSSWTTGFQEQLRDAYDRFNGYANQVVVGHSQGGLRSLSYTAYSESVHDSTRTQVDTDLAKSQIKAMVDIAGPINGFTPLSGGVDAMGSRMQSVVIDAVNAYFALKYDIPNVGAMATLAGYLAKEEDLEGLLFSCGINGIDLQSVAGVSLTNKDLVKVLFRGTFNGVEFVSDQVLKDFTPGADFYKTNYLSTRKVEKIEDEPYSYTTTSIVESSPGHWQRAYIGSIPVLKWVGGKLVWVNQPVYIDIWVFPLYSLVTTVHNTTRPVTKTLEMKPVPRDIYVAAFYGDNNDPLSAINPDDPKMPNPDEIRQFTSKFAENSRTASIVHGAESAFWAVSALSCTATLNIPGAIACNSKALWYGSLSANCSAGYELTKDYVKTYNRRILNTTGGSDCLIPKEASSYSVERFGGTPLSSSQGANILMQGENHLTLASGTAMWGPNASIGAPKRGQGKVSEVLSYHKFDSCFDDYHYFVN